MLNSLLKLIRSYCLSRIETRCDPFPFVDKANAEVYSTDFDSIVDVTCFLGYRFSNGLQSNQFVCLEGVWSPPINHCHGDYKAFYNIYMYIYSSYTMMQNIYSISPIPLTAQTCESLQTIEHASPDTDQTLYGTVVTVTCLEGFQFRNRTETSVAVVCEDGAEWNDTLPGCDGIHLSLSN